MSNVLKTIVGPYSGNVAIWKPYTFAIASPDISIACKVFYDVAPIRFAAVIWDSIAATVLGIQYYQHTDVSPFEKFMLVPGNSPFTAGQNVLVAIQSLSPANVYFLAFDELNIDITHVGELQNYTP